MTDRNVYTKWQNQLPACHWILTSAIVVPLKVWVCSQLARYLRKLWPHLTFMSHKSLNYRFQPWIVHQLQMHALFASTGTIPAVAIKHPLSWPLSLKMTTLSAWTKASAFFTNIRGTSCCIIASCLQVFTQSWVITPQSSDSLEGWEHAPIEHQKHDQLTTAQWTRHWHGIIVIFGFGGIYCKMRTNCPAKFGSVLLG